MVKQFPSMDLHKMVGHFFLAFGWITAFNPQWIPLALSCISSCFAIAAYRSTIKKNQQK
jgi:hypothetical protein